MKLNEDIEYIISHAEEIYTAIIFPDGPICPHCGSSQYYSLRDGRFKCRTCHHTYSLKSSTLAHGSHISISKWMIALYLVLSSKGISSVELSKKLSITQKTAYYMLSKLRYLFFQDETRLDGEIAMDEVYIGGTWRNFSLNKRNELLLKYKLPNNPKTVKEKMAVANKVNSLYKVPVFGMDDGDKAILKVLPRGFKRDDIIYVFNKHSNFVGEAVSDCSKLYKNFFADTGYSVEYNNHSKSQFVTKSGKSSNRIEGEFSQYKRQSLDRWCSISDKYLQLYLDEHCFRFNTRKLSIRERIEVALRKWRQRVKIRDLGDFCSISEFPYRRMEIFDPVEFFNNCGGIVESIEQDGVVYRKADFTKEKWKEREANVRKYKRKKHKT